MGATVFFKINTQKSGINASGFENTKNNTDSLMKIPKEMAGLKTFKKFSDMRKMSHKIFNTFGSNSFNLHL